MRFGMDGRLGAFRCVMVVFGGFRRVLLRFGKAGMVRCGIVRQGTVWLGSVRWGSAGKVRCVWNWSGTAWLCMAGMVVLVSVVRGIVGSVLVRF